MQPSPLLPSPLLVVPFAGAAAVAALVGLLARLGVAARLGVGGGGTDAPAGAADPIESSAGAGAAVLFLLGPGAIDNAARRAGVRAALDACAGRARLVLVMDDAAGWDAELLGPGCDCTHWPCSAAELAFRIERLTAAAPPPGASATDPLLVETLARVNLIGRSPAFLAAMARLQRLVRCDASVLIEGETGTGKELVARAIHYLGTRAAGPFVAVNCGALPDHLVENELFGHARGAYTDAGGAAPGAIGEAAGGTLFLDEVEALSAKAQAALLRFLQEHEYRPLGAAHARRSDARVVAASNADLRVLAGQRTFRADLFFRLEVLSVALPPLRARADDIEPLARHFIERFRRQYGLGALVLDRRSLPALLRYPWPGNVRELENLVHRAVLLADGGSVALHPGGPVGSARPPTAAIEAPAAGPPSAPAIGWSRTDADAPVAGPIDLDQGFAAAKARAIDDFERRYLTALMQASGGNVTQAARRAAKERRALGKLLKKHAIASEPEPPGAAATGRQTAGSPAYRGAK